MAAKKITLCWYAKTPQGWRYFPVIMDRVVGVYQPRHGWVKDKDEVVQYLQGRYVLRSYMAGRKIYRPVESLHPRDAALALRDANIAAREAGPSRSSLSMIGSAMSAYVLDCKQRGAREAALQAKVALNEFIPLCRPFIFVRHINRGHVFAFHQALVKRGCSPRTVRNKHARLKSFLRFCKVDTAFLPPAPKAEYKLPTVYAPEDIEAIRQAAKNSDSYMLMMIEVALKLGLREQEIMHAEWNDVDVHHATFRVQGKVRKNWKFSVKDSEQRDVPVPTDLLTRLSDWHQERKGTTLILGNENDRPERHLLRKLKALARRAALNCGACDGCQRKASAQECERWTLHKFRRTCLTTWLRNGIDLKTVQAWGGHTDMESTMRYLRPASAKDMQARVNAIQW